MAASDTKRVRGLIKQVLQFFCTRCPCQPNATTMRSTAGAIVNPCKIPENYVNPISAQHQTDGRRAGLKIRSSQEGVGSSPTFGTELGSFLSTTGSRHSTPTRQERLETVQHLRKKRQEPVEILPLTGRFPQPEIAGSTPLVPALS